jgi:hypothetical protein
MLLAAAAALLLLAAIAPLGRWERNRQINRQADGMRSLSALAGPDFTGVRPASRLSAGRPAGPMDCLLYKVGDNQIAFELCFDWNGRLIEAIDRRSATTKFWLLRDDPTRSPVRASIRVLLARFHELKLFKDVPLDSPTLPVGYPDVGVTFRR